MIKKLTLLGLSIVFVAVGLVNAKVLAATDTSAPSAEIYTTDNGTYGNAKDWYPRKLENVLANVKDNVGVTKVEFYIDGGLVGTNTKIYGNYGYSIEAKSLSNGVHYYSAKLYDTAGNVGVAKTALGYNKLTFTVDNDNIAPSAQFMIADNTTIGDMKDIYLKELTIPLSNVKDNIGVTKVEFYQNNKLIATNPMIDGLYAVKLDSKTLPNGEYKITMKLYDAAGNVGIAKHIAGMESLTVKVANKENINKPPAVVSGSCQDVSKKINKVTSKILDRSQKNVDYIDGVVKGSLSYANLLNSNKSDLGAVIGSVSNSAGNADSALLELASRSTISCENGDIKAQVAAFKQSVKQLQSAISEYRTNTIKLIVALEKK